MGSEDPARAPLWKKMVAGGFAGGLGSALSNPNDIVKIRMQADTQLQPQRWISHNKRIYLYEGGIPGFWKGASTTVTRAVVLGSTKLATYDEAKLQLERILGLTGIAQQLGASCIAGFAYSCTSAPVDFVRTRFMAAQQMTAQTGVEMAYATPLDVVRQTLRTEGPFAFYKGFLPQWIRATPYSVLQFIAWERLALLTGLSTT